ncbi:MAG: glycosyltransferase family 9 protein [Akkermansiaceae bacterium]|nr:glycosyltransferase family 9 protein [Akkermansiaceae bacterium]NNM28829.1 glycosyltransferase family 9 protein [Akkermansiaceae bacterium]
MAKVAHANPIPDKPPLHLKGGYLAVAPPGDLVEACLATPAVRALRNGRPNATIVLAAPESSAPLWDYLPRLNKVVTFPDKTSPSEIARRLKATGIEFESALAWGESAAARAFKALRINQRIGYDLGGLGASLTDPVEPPAPPYGPVPHRVRHYMHLLERLHIKTFVPENFVTPDLPERPERPRLAVAPGSDFGPSYRWPLERFEEVTRLVMEANAAEVVVVARPGHEREAHELAGRLGGEVDCTAGRLDLPGLLATLAQCSVVLASDGAVPHLAAHLGIPAAVIFGPGDPGVRRPLGRIHQILDAHVECSPCRLAKCPLDHRCMNDLPVATVSAALKEIMLP